MQQQLFFLSSGFWASTHNVLAWIFVIVDLLLFVGFLYAFRGILPYRPDIKVGKRQQNIPKSPQVAIFRERWQSAVKRFGSGSTEAMRLAIFEADLLADSILKEYGIEGETLTDRLSKLTPEDLACLNQLWKAHRFRNELARTADMEFTSDEGQEMLNIYETFLKEVKIL